MEKFRVDVALYYKKYFEKLVLHCPGVELTKYWNSVTVFVNIIVGVIIVNTYPRQLLSYYQVHGDVHYSLFSSWALVW